VAAAGRSRFGDQGTGTTGGRAGAPAGGDEGSSAEGTWLELSVTADQEAVEAVAEILSRATSHGVSVEVPFRLEHEGLAAAPVPGEAVVRAYLPAVGGEADRAIAEVRERLGHLQAFGLRPIGDLGVCAVHEEDWAAAWKQHFPVMRIGRRTVIRPTWRRYRSRPGDVVLALDPGMAFGTGLHPTTRLCLGGLERWADAGLLEGARVLDVGTGSGILAVAAARHGAARVIATDVDPVAVEAAARNARRNRVARRVRVERGSIPPGQATFDLVLANLIASLLVALAGELAAAVRPGDGRPGSGGRLLASGIFIDREPEVRRAFAAAGLRVVERQAEGDWVALDAERPGE
jgi:ribosomal protein L11 methyltransferase